MATSHWWSGVIVVVVGYALVRVFWLVSGIGERAFEFSTVEALAKIILWGGGTVPVAFWMAKRHGLTLGEAMGLGAGALRGLAFGVVATLPMAAAILFMPGRPPFDPDLAFGSGLLGPFAEELLFRGFLFGLLYRAAGWPAPLAIAVSAFMFGGAHPVAVLPMMAGGAVLAWMAYRWRSLWPAVALHGCMNLWWDLGRSDFVRLRGGLDPVSAAQLASVTLAILMTFRYASVAPAGSASRAGRLTLANEP